MQHSLRFFVIVMTRVLLVHITHEGGDVSSGSEVG